MGRGTGVNCTQTLICVEKDRVLYKDSAGVGWGVSAGSVEVGK